VSLLVATTRLGVAADGQSTPATAKATQSPWPMGIARVREVRERVSGFGLTEGADRWAPPKVFL
jgi:hypothetical protein